MSKDDLQTDRILYVFKAAHKAFVETNELVAATVLWVRLISQVRPEPTPSVVDHPFMSMILHKAQTLFMGKVSSL